MSDDDPATKPPYEPGVHATLEVAAPPDDDPEPTPAIDDSAATSDHAMSPTNDPTDSPYTDDELLAAASTESLLEPPAGQNGEPLASSPPPPSPPPPPPPPPPGAGQGQSPHPASEPGARRLYRSTHDRKVGGVCAGIAEHFGIDPTLVRLVTILFAFSGMGLFVYLLAWVIIPKRPAGMATPNPPLPTGERALGVVVGIGVLALALGVAADSWALFALVLIAGGVWLLSERPQLVTAVAATAPPAPASAYTAFDTDQQFANPTPAGSAPTWAAVPPPPATAPTPKKRQRITWFVLSLLGLLAAVAIAASASDWWSVSLTRMMAIALVILAAGVVAGQVRGGGARGLIPLGLLTAVLLIPVIALDGLAIGRGIGDMTYRPLTVDDLEASYDHGIGQLTVDLSELDLTEADRAIEIDIDLGIGELIVIVPDDVGGTAVLTARAGEVRNLTPQGGTLFENGVNVETGTVRLPGDAASLQLDIDVGYGTAELRPVAG